MSKSIYTKGSVSLADVIIILIVIVVIALILFPVFSRNGETPPHRGSCQNNLKELGVALNLYWNDYDGKLPSSALVRHSKKWNRRDFLKFATGQGVTPVPEGSHAQTYRQLLYDHMKNKDIVWCPNDDSDFEDAETPVSYWYKLAVDKAWYGAGCTKPCTSEKDFVYNADQVVFYEHKGWHLDKGSGLKNGVQINVAYLDSHVKTVKIRNATSGDIANCAANTDGQPMYFNWDMKTNTVLPENMPARYVDPARYADKFY